MGNAIEMNKKSTDDVQAIKDDMKDIVKRVSSLKGESLNALYESSEALISNMSELKDKIIGKDLPSKICSCIEKNPLKSALYCVGAGIMLAMFFRK